MFRFVKKIFITSLIFGCSLATKCVSLNNRLSHIRSALIHINPNEPPY